MLNGADKVGVNTAAIKNPTLITELMTLFGRQCVVVAIDAKRNYEIKENVNVFSEDNKKFWFEVFIFGGKQGTGIDVTTWAKEAKKAEVLERFYLLVLMLMVLKMGMIFYLQNLLLTMHLFLLLPLVDVENLMIWWKFLKNQMLMLHLQPQFFTMKLMV